MNRSTERNKEKRKQGAKEEKEGTKEGGNKVKQGKEKEYGTLGRAENLGR